MPADTIRHRMVLPLEEIDANTSVTKFTYRQKGINTRIKSAGELASIYQEKFCGNEEINTKIISVRLIEKFRQRYLDLLEKLKDIEGQDIVQINKNEIEQFERGELDSEIFIMIAKSIGTEVKNGFLITLGKKFFDKITS